MIAKSGIVAALDAAYRVCIRVWSQDPAV